MIRASRNSNLIAAYESLVPEILELWRTSLSMTDARVQSTSDHALIVAALGRGDAMLARRAALRHLWTLYQEVRGAVDNDSPERRSAAEEIWMFG